MRGSPVTFTSLTDLPVKWSLALALLFMCMIYGFSIWHNQSIRPGIDFQTCHFARVTYESVLKRVRRTYHARWPMAD
jgi:hypothetical protein